VEAMTLASRIVILRDGLIAQVGPPKRLYEDPDNMFVGGFIGSPRMNFLPGQITGETKTGFKVALDGFDGVTLTLPRSRDNRCDDGHVMVGVRPEHFTPHGKIKLNVNVDLIEDLGGTSFAYVSAPDGTPVTVELRDNAAMPAVGTAQIGFDPAAAFLFDRASELRL